MCFIKHNWNKWQQYKVQVKESMCWEDERQKDFCIQIREKRICKDCGKMQDRIVR